MKNDELCKYFLSSFIVDIFEIVRIEEDAKNWRMDIYLDEKKNISKGFSINTLISYGWRIVARCMKNIGRNSKATC